MRHIIDYLKRWKNADYPRTPTEIADAVIRDMDRRIAAEGN